MKHNDIKSDTKGIFAIKKSIKNKIDKIKQLVRLKAFSFK